jgi:hypothetical protein
LEEFADAVPECIGGAIGGTSQAGLEFGEGFLDRVKVERVFRQMEQARGARPVKAAASTIDGAGRI